MTSPSSGQTVSGTITISASASDDVGVAGVQFRIDDANFGAEDTSAPYSVSWNTTTVGNGSHTITAVARDAAGNQTTSAPVTVTVSNGAPPASGDTTPPMVSITSPASGSTVRGTITVTAGASDNVGVAGVQFRLDGVNGGGEDTTAPYSIAWNTTRASDGPHSITAVARDAAGNTTTSSPVTVTVSNAEPAPTPATTRFEESAATATGSWVARGPEVATFSGGSAASSNAAESTATFSFTGTAVSWIGLKCNVCGIATVSIDGGTPTTVNTAGPGAVGSGLTSEVVFSSSGLAAGVSHTLVITVTGTTSSGGGHIIVDAFDVTSSSPAAAPAPTTTRTTTRSSILRRALQR